MKSNNTAIPRRIIRILRLTAVAVSAILLSSCNTANIKYYDAELAEPRYKESILLLPPISHDPEMYDNCRELGKYYYMALSRYAEGQITYAGNIESLRQAVMWDNIVNNGIVNTREVAAIARTLGCNSAITVNVVKAKHFPPFRMVLDIIWIDTMSSNIIARVYENIDMTDSDTYYRFENFVGDGPARTAYEQFAPYKAISHTAALRPSSFYYFVASYSTRTIMDKAAGRSTRWWRIF